MNDSSSDDPEQHRSSMATKTVFPILVMLSCSHLLNDTIQSLISSLYPIIKENYKLSYAEIGRITLVYQCTASLLQPIVGFYTDKRPMPFSLVWGMIISLLGLLFISVSPTYILLLLSVSLIGIGSSVFHPEASRVAYMAAGKRHGMAQSLFQVGGNAGSALGPLIAAILIAPYGQNRLIYFTILPLLGAFLLYRVGKWYKNNRDILAKKKFSGKGVGSRFSRKTVGMSLLVLLVLIFSKYVYMASMTSYLTFYLIDKFQISTQAAQMHLFLFLGAVAVGTFAGGPIGDRIGRKFVIWFSILGVAPFALILPYSNLFWTTALSMIIGLILSSAFSAIIVYAQELIPGKVGMIAGLFFGLAFGMAGVGAAIIGALADQHSIQEVFRICAFLPLLGLLTGFLPNTKTL